MVPKEEKSLILIPHIRNVTKRFVQAGSINKEKSTGRLRI
jgi:hypothetical protein